jgi:hypothetical protein
MKRVIASLIAGVLSAGCADTYRMVRSEAPSNVRLMPSDTVFIAVPEDGMYGADTYRGSGQTTAQIIYSTFVKRIRTAKVGRSIQSFDEALDFAKKNNHKYLVYPTILHWEDRATEWSAIPDKVEVKIEVIDVASGNRIEAAIVKGKSGLATFGGDHPQDLLPEPVEEFVSSLY